MARSSSQPSTNTMSKGLHLFSLCCLLLMGIAAVVVQDYKLLVAFSLSAHEHRVLRVDEPPQPSNNATTIVSSNVDLIPNFSQLDIQKALPYFHSWYMRLLVFDGQTWKTYAIGHKSTKLLPEFKSTGRLYQLIPMLVHSFVHNFPKRFEPGQPVFQVLFSEADLISSDCVFTNSKACPSDTFPPILGFGSVFKDETLLPTLKMFPAPARWFACLYNYKTRNQRCKLNQQVNYAKLYHELTPQMVWRGADWPFLPHVKALQSEGFLELRWKTELQWSKEKNSTSMLEHLRNYTADLPPRWKTVLWTVEEDEKQKTAAEQPSVGGGSQWIDSRFYGGLNNQFRDDLIKNGLQVNGERMEEFEMSGYRYQIDIGGGGGTTWDGTLFKLLYPGLLLHHETPTKDFFYDEMLPWKHYIPVKTDLSDLKQKFDWAEANPEGAKLIAAEGTRFAEYLTSPKYMNKVYQELFTNYLGKVVNAYRPNEGMSWTQSIQQYLDSGHEVIQLSTCNDTHCETEGADGVIKKFLYRQTKNY